MQNLLNGISFAEIGSIIQQYIYPILIIILGYIVGLVVQGILRRVLKATKIDEKIGNWVGIKEKSGFALENLVGSIGFWLIFLLFTLQALQLLKLDFASDLRNILLNQLLPAALLFALGWILAVFVRFIIVEFFKRSDLQKRLANVGDLKDSEASFSLGTTLGDIAFYFILLLFLPLILNTLNLEGLNAPLNGLISQFLSAIPNIVTAGIILVLGWVIARFVRNLVTNLLKALGANQIGAKVGITNPALSDVVGTFVYAFILMLVIVEALKKLNIQSVSDPVIGMLNTVMAVVPSILGAGLLLVLAFYVGKLAANLIGSMLEAIGFNRVPEALGISFQAINGQSPAQLVSNVVLVAIMLFAATSASDMLGWSSLTQIISQFIGFGSQIILGIVIFLIGLYLSNIASNMVASTSGKNAKFFATSVRVAILVLVCAMSLSQMGIAQNIVDLSFGVIIAAIGVAIALAFGLGGRDAAGDMLRDWVKKLNSKE
jgi:hypothetical protein